MLCEGLRKSWSQPLAFNTFCTYCITVWETTGVSELKALNICLNRMVRSLRRTSGHAFVALMYNSKSNVQFKINL